MSENLEFWKWIGTGAMALVSPNAVWHWNIEVGATVRRDGVGWCDVKQL